MPSNKEKCLDEESEHEDDQQHTASRHASDPEAQMASEETWRHGIDLSHEKKILRKLDLHLLPLVSLLYLLSFLDRSNIGNARVAGMVTDLHLVGLEYNIAASVFFILYCVAEIPSNILLKLLRPSRWIPSIMVAWGIVMTLMSLVRSFEGLVMRHFLPLDGKANLHGWAWIFLIEGLITIALAIFAYWYMYDYPSTADFLTLEERDFVVERLKHDSTDLATHYDKKFVYQALLDWKCWMMTFIYMGIIIPVYAFSLFIPTIINELGYKASTAQLLSTTPYIAGCFFTVLVGIYSDKLKRRGPFVLACATVAIVGYSILYATPRGRPGVSYAGTVISACGTFPSIAVVLAWAGGNAGGDVKRGVALALTIGVANLGGVCSSFIYRSKNSPRFLIGHGTVIGCLLLAIVLSCVVMVTYWRMNKQRRSNAAERKSITRKLLSSARWATLVLSSDTLFDLTDPGLTGAIMMSITKLKRLYITIKEQQILSANMEATNEMMV
ncbi:hypothetical protein FRC17_010005 [Serendipita sp. 399]|nr:hypothetical protein FRC17_010005 [Serendipita sp. 399]